MDYCVRMFNLFSDIIEDICRIGSNKYCVLFKDGDIIESSNAKWLYRTLKWFQEYRID